MARRKTEEMIYLAGLVDGDGSIYIERSGGYLRASLSVGISHKKTAQWVAKQFGVKMRTHPIKGHKNSYVAQVRSQKARPILQAIYPYLKIKRTQCWIAMAMLYIQTHVTRATPYTEMKLKFYRVMQELNK